MRVDYPVAIDNDYAIWSAFKNNYWPALYFVDAQGQIRHHHFGEGEYEQSELIIQQLLAEAGIGVLGHVVEVIREMRHKGVSVVIAFQDPINVSPAVIELSSVVALQRFNAPNWLCHI